MKELNKYKTFLLEARIGTGGVAAPGFGAPKKTVKKPTKEQLARWRAKSEAEQTAYLKKYPNSMFKNAPKRGNIITRSKKISRSPTAVALTQESLDTLKDWGVKGKTLTKKAAHTMISNANNFLKGSRDKFVATAQETFKKFKAKLSKSEQGAIDEEAESIVKNTHKPSRTLTRRGAKGAFTAMIGLAVAATVFGGVATGFIPPEAIAFIGVKAVDAAWDSIKHVTHESGGVTALLVGAILKDYLDSKDADEDVERTKDKLEKQHGSPDKTEEVETKEPASTVKDLGFEIDRNKYEQDANGNWIRKRS